MSLPFKVCCIQSTDEADMAIAAGALAVGLVAKMPSGPGSISDELIATIAAHVLERHGETIWTVLLTSKTDAQGIARHAAATDVNTVQIVDMPQPDAYGKLRQAHPGLRILQVLHVENDQTIVDAQRIEKYVDAILLDSGKPGAQTPTLGGTGDVHDWSISKRIVEVVDKPVFLAGGLDPDNIAEAISIVRPFGADVCSGLRDKQNGYALTASKLTAFATELENGAGLQSPA